jgi:anti-sigma factor RsiW
MHPPAHGFSGGPLKMRDCSEWQNQFWIALDGELSEPDSLALSAHIKSCTACAEVSREAVATHRRLMEAPLPSGLNLRDASEPPRTERSSAPDAAQLVKPVRKRLLVIDWRVLSAAAAVLIVAGAYVYRNVWPGPNRGIDVAVLVTIAKLEAVSGSVFLMTDLDDSRVPAQAGYRFNSKEGMRIEGPGRATIVYYDGTRIDLISSNSFAKFWLKNLKDFNPIDRDLTNGRKVSLVAGVIEASVTPQTSPMMIGTPHAEAIIVGTQFKLNVTTDATRLEVSEGRVELTRRSDGKKVLVSEKQGATATRDSDLLVEPLK